ncbi:RXT2-like protein [Lipomyces tetrasporus]|uniref:RXT2-like protein n=1 Tax=Lipomyces tetrasporus TaxID=54092 RepID=A0AAD7QQ65_9ASCO|nr:RXT2-like protein [Lipomyces tetrasporus]KAJ8099395.1 RXT2-like protein [Lipomyces tetrasporus]
MVDQHVADEILRFKAALARPEDASDSDSSIGAAGSNRGRKLKRKSRFVQEGRLGVSYKSASRPETIEYASKRRAVVSLKRSYRELDLSDDEYADDEDREDGGNCDEDDPYAGIDLEAILSPIGHPSELPTHPGISRAYTRTTLSTLARRALDLICTEQKQLTQINRLLAAFLGDDPTYIRDHNLHLPELYDHDGETPLAEEPHMSEPNAASKEKSNGIHKSKWNGTIDGVKTEVDESEDTDALPNATAINGKSKSRPEPEETSLEENGDDDETNRAITRRVTRIQATNELEPFFALPKLEVDRDFGFPPEVAQETRQLAQMAAQRGEEFVRSLYKIRSGLLRADRFRAKVYKWCREVGGDISDDEEPAKAV